MAADIPDTEPDSFIAGDTVSWTKSDSNYPATSWTLTYEFRGTQRHTIICAANASDFLATITSTVSATFLPGDYSWFAQVTSGSEKRTIGSGSLTVKQNPAVGTEAQDWRSYWVTMRDAARKTLLETASRHEMQYEIATPNGSTRRLWECSKDELIRFISKCDQMVAMEKNAEAIAQGKPSRNRILTYFTR